jgi:hypothetical protein
VLGILRHRIPWACRHSLRLEEERAFRERRRGRGGGRENIIWATQVKRRGSGGDRRGGYRVAWLSTRGKGGEEPGSAGRRHAVPSNCSFRKFRICTRRRGRGVCTARRELAFRPSPPVAMEGCGWFMVRLGHRCNVGLIFRRA